jgi:hypothetical protein
VIKKNGDRQKNYIERLACSQPGLAGSRKVILATEGTEDTEIKKILLSVISVHSVAKNILPGNGKILAISNLFSHN